MVTASAVSTIHVHVDWADITSTAVSGGRTNTLATTAATTTIASPPAASTVRQIKGVSIYNSHGSSSNAITVQHYDGTTTAILYKYTLGAGERIQIDENGQIVTTDASGYVRSLQSMKTPAGSNPWDETNIALKVSPVTVAQVGGTTAHGSANSQYPVPVGCEVTASMSGETMATEGAITKCYAGRDGAQIVRTDASLEDVTYAVVSATAPATSLVAAQGSGVKACIKHAIVNGIGTTSSNYILLTDGNGGTTKADLIYPSGSAATYVFPLPLCSTANTAWFIDSQGTEAIRVTVGYFKSQE